MVAQQQAPVEVAGWRLQFVAGNYDGGRLREVLYQTTIGETSQEYRLYITDLGCRLVYMDEHRDAVEKEFPNVLEALELITRMETERFNEEPYSPDRCSDAALILRFKQCNEAMQRAKKTDNRWWFRSRAVEYADMLVARGVFEKTEKGGYRRTQKQLDENSRGLRAVK